jgi:hypothetical protein
VAVWDELKVVLVRLRDEQPGILMQYPMPEVDEGREPPFTNRQAIRAIVGPPGRDLPRRRTPILPLTITA